MRSAAATPSFAPEAPSPAATTQCGLDRIQEPQEAAPETEEAPQKRGRRGRLNISETDLKKLYVDEGKTAKQIAEIFGVAHGTVAQRVMKLGLSKRGPSPMKGKTRGKK